MRERIPYLDALRCLAIFLVVLLHNDAPVVVNTACYGRPSWYLCMFLDGAVRLGVPLFFMISGCLLLNGTGAAEPAAFYRKKLPRLLVPLAVWNVIYHWTNAWQFHTDTGLLALLQKAFNRGTGYHMWYIYVLLGLYLLCPFLKRMVDGCTPSQLAALVGIILLLLEIFVIPGFGVSGVLGIVCVVASLVLAGIDDFTFDFLPDFTSAIIRSLFFVVSCSLLSLFGSIWLSRKLFGSRRLNFALHAEQKVEDGFVGVDMAAKEEIGKEGIAFTDLRPAGKVMIGNEVYDAVSDTGAFIERGKVVRVVKYQRGQVYVVIN